MSGSVADTFFASINLAESAIPRGLWDYVGMALTYKKLIIEDAASRDRWERCTTLIDSRVIFVVDAFADANDLTIVTIDNSLLLRD